MKEIKLRTPSGESKIFCGEGVFKEYASGFSDKQCFIVTDRNVYMHYMKEMREIFGANFACKILPAGEAGKTYKNLIEILGAMAEAGLKRGGYVIAFGGGVIGDIAGLAASLYMRGVHLVQIPTTLLAQVDSSVGGKTAVDYGKIKNLIGTFYQPETVIVDPVFLKTLPAREIRCGLGEIVKYGALNKNIYQKLLNRKKSLFDLKFLENITYDCIKHKADIVRRDERDLSGERKTLNLGHTTGHAFELYYGRKSHGEFVLIGMYYELYIAESLGICYGKYPENLVALIKKVIGKIPSYENAENAAKLAKFDKKNGQDGISLIVPKEEGECSEINLSIDRYIKLIGECSAKLKYENS